MAVPIVPNRQQLIQVAGGDPELMRGLERLFLVAGELTPDQVTAVLVSIAALEKAPDPARINALAGAVADLIAYAGLSPPERPQDEGNSLLPPLVATIDGLADVDAPSPSDGDVLQYDGALWVPITPVPVSGATGSFTTVDSKTVTVTDGIITAIV